MNRLQRLTVIACHAALALLAILALPLAAQAERVTEAEARRAAESYVQFILRQDGQWGGHATARVLSMEPFQRGPRVLGHFCAIAPVGYVVVALDRELAPIRAYSVRHDLDPNAENGMTALLKDRLEQLYTSIERELGHAPSLTESYHAVLPVDFRPIWGALTDLDFDPERYVDERGSRAAGMDYQEGDEFLLTTWAQGPPYNDECPDMGCEWPQFGYHNTNAVVGCVATAGAQVMKFWNWPPTGVGHLYGDYYAWYRMADTYVYDALDDRFVDGQGQPLSQEQLDAVAEISYEIGVALEMVYGCGSSGAYTFDMEGVYEDVFRYDAACRVCHRYDYTYETWFSLMRGELNNNRPVQYRIPGHSVVVDGWKEEWIGGQYEWIHAVYGWNGGSDGWWAPDELPQGSPEEEYLLSHILPGCAVGDELAGIIGGGEYGMIYFDRDATSDGVLIATGVAAQVLRGGFILENTSPSTGAIAFFGEPDANTVVFMNGDRNGDNRILIHDGSFRLLSGGQMVLH